MSGQLKEVRIRIQSVISTQQITKAMKMVSAAKLRRAGDAIQRMRPYSEKLTEILQNLSTGASSDGSFAIEYAKERKPVHVMLVLITSDRGLCGGFNSNLIKLTKKAIETQYQEQAQGGTLQLMCIGKKGYDAFKKVNFTVNTEYQNLFQNLNFDDASTAAEWIMSQFVAGKLDKVELIYSKFKNAVVQIPQQEQFLPVVSSVSSEEKNAASRQTDYIFEPSKAAILTELVPKILKTQFFRALLDSNASEHGARMTAMDNATNNANELLKSLRISYNRARQAAITTELTEIVSGAAALEEG